MPRYRAIYRVILVAQGLAVCAILLAFACLTRDLLAGGFSRWAATFGSAAVVGFSGVILYDLVDQWRRAA